MDHARSSNRKCPLYYSKPCHMCGTTLESGMHRCQNPSNRLCTRRYCTKCLDRHYPAATHLYVHRIAFTRLPITYQLVASMDVNDVMSRGKKWPCPSCRGICKCRSCQGKYFAAKDNNEMEDTTPTPATIISNDTKRNMTSSTSSNEEEEGEEDEEAVETDSSRTKSNAHDSNVLTAANYNDFVSSLLNGDWATREYTLGMVLKALQDVSNGIPVVHAADQNRVPRSRIYSSLASAAKLHVPNTIERARLCARVIQPFLEQRKELEATSALSSMSKKKDQTPVITAASSTSSPSTPTPMDTPETEKATATSTTEEAATSNIVTVDHPTISSSSTTAVHQWPSLESLSSEPLVIVGPATNSSSISSQTASKSLANTLQPQPT
jgi:hypothetical protein